MNPFELYINNRQIRDWAEWPATAVEVRRDTENLTLAVQLENIKLIGADADYVKQQGVQVLNLKLRIAGLELKGKVFPGGVLYGRDYVVLSAELDGLSDFTRLVEGRLLPDAQRREVRILVSPREDRALVMVLLLGIFVITYIVVKETSDIIKELGIVLGIGAAGATGGIGATIAKVAILAARAAYVAALVVAMVQLVRELLNYIDRIIKVRAFRLLDALEYFAQAAGYSVQAPAWLREVWLIGGGQEAWEASEVFRIAKRLTNSLLFVRGNTIVFINAQSADFPAVLRKAWEEAYKHNLLELPRREIVSLVRDAAEAHCLDLPAAVEIARSAGRGYTRHDIPLAPGKRAGQRKEMEFIRRFLQAVGRFSRRFRNVAAQYAGYEGLLIVERDIFVPKVIYATDPENLPPDSAEQLLRRVADAYQQRQAKRIVESVVMPFAAAEFQTLAASGFPGVRSLRWWPAEERAEIEYEYRDLAVSISENIRII